MITAAQFFKEATKDFSALNHLKGKYLSQFHLFEMMDKDPEQKREMDIASQKY